jgi:hypothetical protein
MDPIPRSANSGSGEAVWGSFFPPWAFWSLVDAAPALWPDWSLEEEEAALPLLLCPLVAPVAALPLWSLVDGVAAAPAPLCDPLLEPTGCE